MQHEFLNDVKPIKRLALLADGSDRIMFGRLKLHEGTVKMTELETDLPSA